MGITMKAGLEDIIAGESGICYIDGNKGILAYRGYNIHELASNSTFEETCFLLWFGRLPKQAELTDISDKLSANRAIPRHVTDAIRAMPKKALPMEVLRTAVSTLSMYDPDAEDMTAEANLRKAIRLTAQTATIVTAFHRLRNGQEPVAPRADLSHAGNYAYMLNGAPPNDTMTKALDIALILHADHEWNASTFAGRVTAATLSDIYSAVTSAIGALKGPLHGGANEAVMRMLLEIGDVSKVDSYVRDIFAAKKKIPGFGHRVYHTEDPRATYLRRMSKEACERAGQPKWYEMSARIEEIVKSEKKLNPNVDFYSASTYYVSGMPIDLFTPFFAISRMSGWTAHILEQYSNNRLIRPRAEYIGPSPDLKWVPVNQR
jgi:citrate synthase